MCTITLQYDEKNSIAQNAIEQLLKTGVFQVTYSEASTEGEELSEAEECEAFLYTSRVNAAKNFAKYL